MDLIDKDLCFVLSSFVSRIDCIEMASENQLCGKGYELTLFLFTDILVVAKRKSNKTLSISRSPSTASLAGVGTLGHGQGLLQTKVGCYIVFDAMTAKGFEMYHQILY